MRLGVIKNLCSLSWGGGDRIDPDCPINIAWSKSEVLKFPQFPETDQMLEAQFYVFCVRNEFEMKCLAFFTELNY